jgi:Lon protease-like protein
MELLRDFPLFPLRLVALPSELVPLHIFEERYKALVERCIAEPSEFGIVCVDEEDDDSVAEVGCALEIVEVLERFDDGRVNLVARGTRPLRVITQQDDFPYPAGEVVFLDDTDDEPEPDLLAEVHEAYADLVRQATDKEPDLAEIAAMSAYQIAATVEFALEAKQQLLETRSETARSEQLLRLLRGALKRLEFMERAQARAKSNGKVRL